MHRYPSSRGRAASVALALLAALFLGAAAWAFQGAKAPARAPKHTNRLSKETSPYLLQHQHNPVDWYPWGPEAFEKAKREGKPIFLSVGYSSCHWCHVMERESFEDEGIAAQLNADFVPIKVDREERPDVDEIYMAAVQLTTGRGGWPMSTFLTPEAKPFYGGTYFRRDDFAELLRKVKEAWAKPETRQQLEEGAERLAQAIGQATARAPDAGAVTPALLEPAVRSLMEQFDPKEGGFSAAPKFPPATRLSLLLAQHRKKPDPELLKAVTLTLDRMARGGLYDQVGGGFHRYSVDEKWLVPHFEKMLYDNALLATVYLEAYQTTRKPDYRRVAVETLDFVLRELRDPAPAQAGGGGFWSSLDADSDGGKGEREEGKFYVWTPEQVIAVLGKADGALFNRVYDVTPAGNFEGHSIPNRIAKPVEAWAREMKTSPEALWKRLDALRAKLRTARETRVRPPLDDKVLANWNGLTIRALALGYDVTGEARYRQAAETAAEFLLSRMRKDGKLVHSYRKGRTQPQAFLEDYSFVTVGLLELHRATGEARWLKEAEALARGMVTDFWDTKTGTFYSTPRGHETLLARPSSPDDNATPSGQSMAVLALVRLSRRTGDAGLRATAQQALDHTATSMKRFPAAMPGMLLATHTYFTPDDGDAAPGKAAGPVAAVASGPASVRVGQEFEATVRLTIQPGWHINAQKPSDPSLVPTQVEAAGGPFKVVSAAYPPAQQLKLGISPQPMAVYTGKPEIRLKLKPLPGAEKAAELRLRLRYQACDDQVCQRPVETVLTVPLKRIME